jgi:MFS family permease
MPTDGFRSWYALFFLTFAYVFAFVDRQILNLLVDPVKRDLLLSDTQVSLLQGIAFTATYVLFGPLFGRWVDTGNRRNIVVLGVVIWSSFTVLCGFADSFWELFFARAGIGAAEACLAPAAWSMIADYFSPKRLPRAMSLFLMAPYIGGGLALIAGGVVIAALAEISAMPAWLAGFTTWQLIFVLIGVPGILVGVAILSLREPPRRIAASDVGGPDQHYSVRETVAFFVTRRGFYLRFYGGISLLVIVLYALPAWLPAYFMRHYGADPGAVGLQYGVLVLVMGSIGVLSGPSVGRWLARRGFVDIQIRVAAMASLAIVPFCVLLPLMPSYPLALLVAAGATFFYSLPQAMSASALQMVTPNRLRGVAVSLYVFAISGIGLGVAPTAVALVTDYVFRDPARVGESLAVVCTLCAVGGGWLLYGALPLYRAALAGDTPAPSSTINASSKGDNHASR